MFIFFKANLLKVLTKDFGNEFDELLPGMFARRNLHDAKLLNEAVKVPNWTVAFYTEKFFNPNHIYH